MLAIMVEKTIKREPAVLYEEPLFRTEAGALLFAYNFVHGTMKGSALAQMMADTKGRKGRGLGGLDGAAQAGLIQVRLSRLSKVRQAILIARYTATSTPCSCGSPCCRGYRENPEWLRAVEIIAEYVLMMGATGTISHFRLRMALVKRYFGVRVSFLEVAAQCGINRDTASAHNKKVVDLLKGEEYLAKLEAKGLLEEAGLVE